MTVVIMFLSGFPTLIRDQHLSRVDNLVFEDIVLGRGGKLCRNELFKYRTALL